MRVENTDMGENQEKRGDEEECDGEMESGGNKP